LRQQPLVL